MKKIKYILDMLNWNNSLEVQKRGIFLASNIKSLEYFFQPLIYNHGKDVWDNCAIVVSNRTDEELEHYFCEMLEWLKDLNWPGSITILERLKTIPYSKIRNSLYYAIDLAIKNKDDSWLENLIELVQNEIEKKMLLDLLEQFVYQGDKEYNLFLKSFTLKIEDLCKLNVLLRDLNNVDNDIDILYKIVKYRDPLFIPYLKKIMNNNNNQNIKCIARVALKNINELIGNNMQIYDDRFNNKFIEFLKKLIIDYKNIDFSIYDKLYKTKYGLSKIRLIYLYKAVCSQESRNVALRTLSLFRNEFFMPIFEMYKDNSNQITQKLSEIAIKNIM